MRAWPRSGGPLIRAFVRLGDGTPAARSFLGVELAPGFPWRTSFAEGPVAEVPSLAPGRYTVTAGLPGGPYARFTGVELGDGDVRLEVALGADGALEVEARDGPSGAPIEGAALEIAFADGGTLPPAPGEPFDIAILTGPDGIARRERLPAGSYRVRVSAPDGHAAEIAASVRGGEVTRVAAALP